jgi:hypothetical protein
MAKALAKSREHFAIALPCGTVLAMIVQPNNKK